jgi:hypothetical protein
MNKFVVDLRNKMNLDLQFSCIYCTLTTEIRSQAKTRASIKFLKTQILHICRAPELEAENPQRAVGQKKVAVNGGLV